MQGRKLDDRGWSHVLYAEGFGSHERSLSCWLCTHENLPEMEFGFLLDLKADLIALELHAVKPPSRAMAVEQKLPLSKHAVIPSVVSLTVAQQT